jgi:hypothetical protein
MIKKGWEKCRLAVAYSDVPLRKVMELQVANDDADGDEEWGPDEDAALEQALA